MEKVFFQDGCCAKISSSSHQGVSVASGLRIGDFPATFSAIEGAVQDIVVADEGSMINDVLSEICIHVFSDNECNLFDNSNNEYNLFDVLNAWKNC